ncbi:unnamed protein product [Gadus morhua 'NCC']
MTGRPPGAMEGCSKEEGGITEGRRGQGMEGVGITRPSDPLITLMTVEGGDHRVGRPLLVEPDLLETHIVTYSPRQEGEVLITVQGLNRSCKEPKGAVRTGSWKEEVQGGAEKRHSADSLLGSIPS